MYWCTALPRMPIVLLQTAMSTFDFQTQRWWIWVGVAYCIFLFVALTLAAAIALRFIDPPHAQPVVPALIATTTLQQRSRRKGLKIGEGKQPEICFCLAATFRRWREHCSITRRADAHCAMCHMQVASSREGTSPVKLGIQHSQTSGM